PAERSSIHEERNAWHHPPGDPGSRRLRRWWLHPPGWGYRGRGLVRGGREVWLEEDHARGSEPAARKPAPHPREAHRSAAEEGFPQQRDPLRAPGPGGGAPRARQGSRGPGGHAPRHGAEADRSEEHTSELQ